MDHQLSTDEQHLETIVDAVSSGVSLKEIHGLTDEHMESLYGVAYDLYHDGRLDEAEKFFRFLCIYDFYSVDFWMGLAAVHQMKREYQKAADFYAVAFALGKRDYRPMLHAGQCQLAMGRRGKARQCFSVIVESSGDDTLIERAKAYLDVMAVERNNEGNSEQK
ncbi:chaperone protein SicA [Burkholderia ubonensis]|uniref:type III secretion system translocator chaperone SicA n=1 Tax=Burkholderia ubonensis TaxID=101571 RepID=UPI0007537B5E|nr:type III secretion system translocator chaperone SicA [Burkholderia ubonensis]KVO87690.1 chaperone protein SicA [Burkholderia ubonensis]KVZ57307.1 chaperone protein SicA [Burkholderia ubonensis]KVZ73004.1 chaperone protein SicA [Burkholderia ubonensis]